MLPVKRLAEEKPEIAALAGLAAFALPALSAEPFRKDSSGLFSVSLALSRSHLHLISSWRNPEALDRSAVNSFTEKLWEKDVAEFFIKAKSGPSYLEFNLSPQGAWWSAFFQTYRQGNGLELKGASASCCDIPSTNGFERISVLNAPINELPEGISIEDGVQANLCGIWGDEPRCYFSFCPLSAVDFHLIDEFFPLHMR